MDVLNNILATLQHISKSLRDYVYNRGSILDHGSLTENSVTFVLRNQNVINSSSFTADTVPMKLPGSVIIFDPTDTFADVIVHAQFQDNGPFIPLLPGKSYDFRPRAFRQVKFSFLMKSPDTVATGAAGSILGRITIGTDLDSNPNGLTPGLALYTRSLPSLGTSGNAPLAVNPGGGAGIFTNFSIFVVESDFTLDRRTVEIDATIYNDGVADIYIGYRHTALTAGVAAGLLKADTLANRQMVKRLTPGQSAAVYLRGRNPTEFLVGEYDSVIIYSDDAAATYSWLGVQRSIS